tara:strand:- start:1605 stop:2210 length:606 start_codon:yes stop_codon:yes gene_type:complete
MKALNDNQKITEFSDIKIIDNFFTEECLNILKVRVLFCKYFDNQYKSYVATNYCPGQDYLTDIITKEIHNKYVLPKFIRGWSFVYFKNDEGVHMHADPSIVNLNVWVSSDASVFDSSKNGLNIYKIMPPKNWTRKDWNGNPDKVKEYIKEKNIQPVKISYKSNRAVFFNGSYFHETNGVSMKDGIENRRVSYTLLFGNNLE